MHYNLPRTQIFGAILLLLQFLYANAFWRLLCDGSVGLARIDPLMNPGGVSEHVHTIKGGSAFSPSSLSADLAKSDCSSCDVKEDNSAYWTPALYFINTDDNTVEVVPEKPPHKTYYFLNTGMTSDGKPQKIEAFPHGFKMIAGTNRNRNSSLPDPDPNPLGPWVDDSQDLREQRALGFNCLNYAKNRPEPSLSRHFMPEKSYLDQNCPDGVRLELMFPSCWNGELDGGSQFKTHVAFPDGVMVGNCPKGYDRRLVSLFFETIVATDQFKGKNGKFVFSNGDPTGYGYHGDFIEAWETGVLQQAIDQCTNPSGNERDCPVFTFHDAPGECQMESPLLASISKENVLGPRQGLPNGVQIQSGPEQASKPGNSGSNGYAPAGKPFEIAPPSPETTSVAKIPTVPVSAPYKHSSVYASVHTSATTSDSPSIELTSVKNDVAKASSSSSLSASTLLPPVQVPVAARPSTFAISVIPPASSSPSPPTTSAPATIAQAWVPEQGPVYTNYYTSGREAHEVIVYVEEVTVTAEVAYAKRTAPPEPHAKIEHHHRRHVNGHTHHAAHGNGGLRRR